GGDIDLFILRALQGAGKGDLAQRMISGEKGKGMGGALGPLGGGKRGGGGMGKSGQNEPKLLKHRTLPRTRGGRVDMVITDLAVFTIDKKGGGGMTLVELAPGATLDEVRSKTEANYHVANTL